MFAKKLTFIGIFIVVLLLVAGTLTPPATAVNGGGDVPVGDLITSITANVTGLPHLGGEIVVSDLDNEQYLPSVAYNWKHDEYLVVWHNKWSSNRDIYAQRINGQGELLSWFAVGPTAPLNPYPNDRAQPSVAYDPVNDRYLVTWVYDKNGDGSDWDVHGVFVNWDGPIPGQHQINISDWGTHQWNPKVVYGRAAEEFLVVWNNEYQSGTLPMYISGRRVKAADGTFPAGIGTLTINHASENRINPAVAYNLARNEYMIVYDNAADIFGMRLTGDLNHNFGGEFSIAAWSGAEIEPSVAACRETDQYLVTWQNPQPDIYVRFIKGDGTIDGGPLHLDSTSVAEIKSQVACNEAGNQFLVVWQQQFSNAAGPYGIRGQFVNNDKTLGTPFTIVSPWVGGSAEFTTPVVAGGNVNYLTVWEHDRNGTVYQDVHGRLITPHTVFLPTVVR